jgi:predicted transcriptional regulator
MKLKISKSQIKILQAISKEPLTAADIRFKTGISPLKFSPQIKALINLRLAISRAGKYIITQAGRDIISREEKDIENKELFK